MTRVRPVSSEMDLWGAIQPRTSVGISLKEHWGGAVGTVAPGRKPVNEYTSSYFLICSQHFRVERSFKITLSYSSLQLDCSPWHPTRSDPWCPRALLDMCRMYITVLKKWRRAAFLKGQILFQLSPNLPTALDSHLEPQLSFLITF